MICLENVGFEYLGQEMQFPKITGYSMQRCDMGVRRPELLDPNCGDRWAGNIWAYMRGPNFNFDCRNW